MRAIVKEKRKWEAHEARLVWQLEDLEERLAMSVFCRPDFIPVQSFEQTETFGQLQQATPLTTTPEVLWKTR